MSFELIENEVPRAKIRVIGIGGGPEHLRWGGGQAQGELGS